MNPSYEDMKKQAELLQTEIGSKIIFFSKLCSGKKQPFSGPSAAEPLLNTESVIDTTSMEIEDLLEKFNKITQKMANNDKITSLPIAVYTINKLRETYQDYRNEYRKNLENYRIRRDRENLMQRVQIDIDLHHGGDPNNLNRRTDMYLREHEHIRSSDRLIDDQIGIAVETREHLMSQRNTMKKLQTRLHDIGHRFPVVNSLVQRINLRKKRDSIIIGLIVFFCVLFLLFYMFH